MENIIQIKNLGKKYKITHATAKYATLRDIFEYMLRHPFLFLRDSAKRIGKKEKKEEFWALKDINLDIKKGEIIGIIGKNGAGKSTLLKILSRITPPTTGEIRVNGTIASLLEVGTGFHPELTGRENIYLNAAILGMSKKETDEKFDEIVAFSGVERFLDTPVKRYSSGMSVRLAFSVAAHLEPDILVIDEVLAVGDAEFQKKSLGKMEEVTQKSDRTIIFVSHNMKVVEQLCTRVVLIEKGMITKIGPTRKIIGEYLNNLLLEGNGETILAEKKDSDITFTKIYIKNSSGAITGSLGHDESYSIHLEMKVKKETRGVDISVSFKNSENTDIVFSSLSDSNSYNLRHFSPGSYFFTVKFSGGFLMPDNYFIRISAHNPGTINIDTREDVLGFTILEVPGTRALNYGVGCVTIPNSWEAK